MRARGKLVGHENDDGHHTLFSLLQRAFAQYPSESLRFWEKKRRFPNYLTYFSCNAQLAEEPIEGLAHLGGGSIDKLKEEDQKSRA